MSYGFVEQGIRRVSQGFVELHGVIKPRKPHDVNNHNDGPKPEKPRVEPELPLLGIHDHTDTLGFSDPAERDPNIIDRRATSGSAIIRGIEHGRIYSLFDPENNGEATEIGLPEGGFHIAGPGYLKGLSMDTRIENGFE